ncbi:hypothetical protein [Actinoplanes xinjiangensis]|uniref:hypothetical protein n=1 Tax=Actinoplanes xinjiangensis TaxID=512350 RepID=UPI000D6D2354|nr:hypothetical protein [Actinoplanes xinjiangensis]GIF41631.1 hypothetical protein Axi01nite_59420 [Actinoplanes xinjiangensis]
MRRFIPEASAVRIGSGAETANEAPPRRLAAERAGRLRLDAEARRIYHEEMRAAAEDVNRHHHYATLAGPPRD